MKRRRKVWQHDVQKVSEDQLRELLHSLGWEVDPIGDYGEDFLVRIFHEGNPTLGVEVNSSREVSTNVVSEYADTFRLQKI